jgi:hypothetical protein
MKWPGTGRLRTCSTLSQDVLFFVGEQTGRTADRSTAINPGLLRRSRLLLHQFNFTHERGFQFIYGFVKIVRYRDGE